MSKDIREQILGIIDEGLRGISHAGTGRVAVIITDKRVIVIELEKYKKWLKNNGGILRNEMLEDLSHSISRWSWDFQIYRKDIAKIKIRSKRRIFLLPVPAKLEIIPKSRIRHLNVFEIQIRDNDEVDKLNNVMRSLPELID